MVKIEYDSMINNPTEIITYAIKNSDLLSFITYQKKPYSQRPPNCDHDDFLSEIQKELVAQIVGIRKWSGTSVKDNHMVMNVYPCNKVIRTFLLKHPDLFLVESEFPEDICFYRGHQAWLSTTTHEKIATICCATDKDLAFLKKLQIPYVNIGMVKPFRLPPLEQKELL